MFILGPIGFLTPWLLAALAALPVLWIILRALPPSPKIVQFPGIRLLKGLADQNPVAQRTPWWLLLLRVLAIAALILGFASPIWKPAPSERTDGPLLVVVDGGWASAPVWSQIQTRAAREFEAAGSAGQPAALLIADGRADGALPFTQASDLGGRIRAVQPAAWSTEYPADPKAALANAPAGLHTLWLSDGLEHPRRAEWLAELQARGTVTVVPPEAAVQSLALEGGEHPALVYRATGALPAPVIRAVGPDPQGVMRELAKLKPADPRVTDGITTRAVPVDLPSELRNRITRFEIEGVPSAGAVVLADDRVRRRKVALVGDGRATEGQELLSPMHYLNQAIAPTNDVITGNLADVIQAAPDVIVLVDQMVPTDSGPLEEWVNSGGLLIRFGGPRMAASPRLGDEALLPVRLREGGRDIGGALSWGEPRSIAPFDANGPFAGLRAPADVTIRAQLLPEPAPDLNQLIVASLSDQTPLVTREWLDQGQVVLFHTTANAEWTNLPLSELFVQMLDRLIQTARTAETVSGQDAAEQVHWTAEALIDGFGRPAPVGELAPVAATDFAKGPSAIAPAGTYASGERRAALNAGGELALPGWGTAQIEAATTSPGVPVAKWLIAAAALAFALDALGSAMLARGRKAVA